MVFPHSPMFSLYEVYNDLEKEIKNTKWYEVLKRRKLKQLLFDKRQEGFNIGFNSAIQDLVDCGILKEVKKD